jgi:hypothetical protein
VRTNRTDDDGYPAYQGVKWRGVHNQLDASLMDMMMTAVPMAAMCRKRP